MIIKKFNDDWKFWLDKNSFALVWDIPGHARTITLPHDAMIETPAHPDSLNGTNTGFRDGEVYNYVKLLYPEASDKEKTLMLKFEGIYMNALVYVNGQLAAKCPNGYTGFYVELNNYLKYGQENEIRVIVRNAGMTNSRWYSGGGIYRDAYWLEAGKTFIKPEGVFVKTESIETDGAVLNIQTVVKNRDSAYHIVNVVTEIKDANGIVVAEDVRPLTLFENEERKSSARVVVENPKLWSDKTPNLYTIETKLVDGEDVIDEHTDTFGIRMLSLDAKHGFRVNGQTVKFRGACIHHDSGILGAATFDDAEYRRVRILKEAGFNAIRMSHHPAAPALLRACDELGMYVMDETFDMWQRCKSTLDYGLVFDEWWERDVETMVIKDYNRPSVVMYSIGNEIPEIGTNQGAQIAQNISDKIKSLDDTRYTLASINGVFAAGDTMPEILQDLSDELHATGQLDEGTNVNDFMSVMDEHMDKILVHKNITQRLDMACAGVDIAGYNYMTERYEKDGMERPNRVIVGSETYPGSIAGNWDLVEKHDYLIGDFMWTGWDYIGEAGIGVIGYAFGEGGFGVQFPCQLAYTGTIDITGVRRPGSYLSEIVYGLRKAPYIAVQNPYKYGVPPMMTPWAISDSISSWTYEGVEGKPVVLEIYAPGDEVEVFVNEKSLGKKTSGKAVEYKVLYETTYEPGIVEAVSYANGVEIGRSSIVTASTDTALTAYVENGRDNELVYINICNQDANGIVNTDKVVHMKATVEGAMEARFGTGNPKPLTNYIDMATDSWHGHALLVARRNKDGGKIKVTVRTDEQILNLEV